MMSLEEAQGIVKEWVGRTAEHKVVMALYACLDNEIAHDETFLLGVLGDKAEALFPEEFEQEE